MGFEFSALRVDVYDYWYEKTGHSKLNVSDFGWWSCDSCKRRGDDWMSPEDYPCIEEKPASE